jgi:hypothetical protein
VVARERGGFPNLAVKQTLRSLEMVLEETNRRFAGLVERMRDKLLTGESSPDQLHAELGRFAVGVLVALFGDIHSSVRERSIVAVGGLGTTAMPAVPDLVTIILRDRGNRTSLDMDAWCAARALSDIGEAVVPVLLSVMEQATPDAKCYFLAALRNMGEKARVAVPALTSMLDVPDSNIVYNALEALRSIAKQPLPASILIKGFRGGHPSTTKDLIEELGKIRPLPLSPLENALAHSDAHIRAGVCQTIGSFGEVAKPLVPKLAAMLGDPSPFTQMGAARGLAKLGQFRLWYMRSPKRIRFKHASPAGRWWKLATNTHHLA